MFLVTGSRPDQCPNDMPPFILNTPQMIPMECGNSLQKNMVSLIGGV